MFQTFEQAQHFVAEHCIQVVDLKFCDLWGRWHHLTIPVSQFEPKLMEEGIGFDGSSVGLKSVKAGDMVLVPDLTAAFVDPFWETPTLSFICRTFEADTHEVFANDPRNLAIRAEPASLNVALSALEADHAFLTEGGVFSAEMLRQWVDYKRQYEYFAIRNRPHPYEMSLYFDV